MNLDSMHDILLAMSIKNNGDWNKMYEMLKKKIYLEEEEIRQAPSKINSYFLTLADSNYPEKLKDCWHPPICFYYYGNLSLLGSKSILSVVGSRTPNDYSILKTEELISQTVKANKEVVVCSGMAKGLDSIAMRASMSQGGKIIAILGSGIDEVYPFDSKDIYEYCKTNNGLVLSEWPNKIPPDKSHFPFRNRLIASLADALFVGQCQVQSGTSITVRYALDAGKNILVLPQQTDENDMSDVLIKEGAEVVLSHKDLLQGLGLKI